MRIVSQECEGNCFALRRAATWDALRPCVVLETVVGSQAWGLANEASDVDMRGVFGLALRPRRQGARPRQRRWQPHLLGDLQGRGAGPPRRPQHPGDALRPQRRSPALRLPLSTRQAIAR